jgi:hypothetical protein
VCVCEFFCERESARLREGMYTVSSTATSTSRRLDSPLYRAISDMMDETSAGVCSLARVRCVISLGYVQMEGVQFEKKRKLRKQETGK